MSVWDYLAVYDRGDGREALVPNYFYDDQINVKHETFTPTMSKLRSPFVLLKKRLGINFFDESFDEDINAIVSQSLQFTIDIGANPIIYGRIVETPELLDYESAPILYPMQKASFYKYGIDPNVDLKFFNNYYSWYEIFETPLSDPFIDQSYNDKVDEYTSHIDMLGGVFNFIDDEDLVRGFEPPSETNLSAADYLRTLEDLLVLMDELCYVNAKIYFDSPDSGYVTNQFAQRKGELQWRIQSLLEDRMNIGYGPVEPSVIP